jgi:hypothetical protein
LALFGNYEQFHCFALVDLIFAVHRYNIRVERFNNVAPKLFSKSATRLDNDDGGTLNALAALVKLLVSATLLKYRIARS